MILMGFSYAKIAVGILLVSLAVLVLVIAYRKFLAFLAKGEIPPDKYCTLNSLEVNPAKGEIEFYFTNEETTFVHFEILNSDYSLNKEISAKEHKSGGHIIRFDSSKVENGAYFFQLRTENQKTTKRFDILN